MDRVRPIVSRNIALIILCGFFFTLANLLQSTTYWRFEQNEDGQGVLPITATEMLLVAMTNESDVTETYSPEEEQNNDEVPTASDPQLQHYANHDAPFEWSACILTRDDNKIMPEWLAYHYEVLPLRRLIIALDPASETDGSPIYDAYRSIGMNITVWHDEDYWYDGYGKFDRHIPANSSKKDKHEVYLWRQQVFLTKCTRQLKAEGATWVLLVDTDEFLVFNHYKPDEGEPIYCANKHGRNKAARDRCSEEYHERQSSKKDGDERTRLPIHGTPNSTVAHYLASQYEPLVEQNHWYGAPCWVLPRSLWGAQESDNTEIEPQFVPSGWNISNFNTLRFRQHGELQNSLPGKPIVDVSRVDRLDNHHIPNPHRPFPRGNLCKGGPFVKNFDSIMRVHHYTGPIDVFLSRPGREVHQFYGRQPKVYGSETKHLGWLKSFADRVGHEKAQYLTEGLRAWAFKNDTAIFAERERQIAADPELAATKEVRVNISAILHGR